MLSPRWRKVLRDLWGNKTRTVLVVLSIAVGVFAVGAISSSQIILGRDLDITYMATNPISASMFTEPFDDDLLAAVRQMPEVGDVDGSRSFTVRLQIGPDEWRSLELFGVRDYEDQRVDIIKPQTGDWPPADKELLIERASLPLTNAQVGESVVVELPDGKLRQLRIAGLAHHMLRPPAQFTGVASGYITLDTLEWLGQERSYNVLQFYVAEKANDKEHIQGVSRLVRDKVEKGGRTVFETFIPTPLKHPADDAVQPILLVMQVLGYLALALSAFLIVNTIGAILAQQVRQIGMMKAIGARTGQVMGMYLGMVLIFGLLSLLVAVPLGALGARIFVTYLANIINFDVISFAIPPQVLALEIAIGLAVPLLASLYPVIAGARVTVREAISSYGIGKGRAIKKEPAANSLFWWFNRWLSVLASWFPRPLLLSLRNTFRRKGRLALTLITLTLGGGIFIAVFSVRESLLLTLDDALRYRNYDLEVRFQRPYRIDALEREALAVPGVVRAESWSFSSARRQRPNDTESDNIFVFAPPIGSDMIKPTVIDGRWLLPGDENALVINTDLLRDEQDIKVGDQIELKIEGREQYWRVVGVVRGVLAGPFAYANYPYFAQVVRGVGQASRVHIVTDQHDEATQLLVANALKERFEAAGMNVGSTETTIESVRGVGSQFDIIVVFLMIMAVLIAVVGGLGLMGTMSINVLERTREIGVMRAIGASDGAVLQIFMLEGVLIGALSWLAGAVMAVPLSRALSDVVGQAFLRAPLSYSFSTFGVLLWLGIAVTLAAMATFVPARNASRISVRDVLAYE